MNKLSFLILSLVPATALAHPGHGGQLPVEPRTIVAALAIAVLGLGAWGWSKSRSPS